MMTCQQYIWAIVAVSALLFPQTLKAEIYSLDFSTDGSLQSVFQSGLRPYRQQGFEKDKCEVRNSEIGVLLPGNVKLPSMKYEWAEFFVYQNDLLGSAEFRTGNLSIDEARNVLDAFLKISGGLSHPKLESMFQVIAKNPLGFEPTFSEGIKGTPSWIVFIRKSYNEKLPIKVGLKIDWKRPHKEAVFRETLIEPPAGFKDISMKAPPVQAEPPTPESSPPITLTAEQRLKPAASPTGSPINEPRQTLSEFPVVLGVIISALVLIVIIFLLKWRS